MHILTVGHVTYRLTFIKLIAVPKILFVCWRNCQKQIQQQWSRFTNQRTPSAECQNIINNLLTPNLSNMSLVNDIKLF